MRAQQSRVKECTVEEPKNAPEHLGRIIEKDDKCLKNNKYLTPWPRHFAERPQKGPELHELVRYMEANVCTNIQILDHTSNMLNYEIAQATKNPISIHEVLLNDFPWNQLVRISFSFIIRSYRANKIPCRPTWKGIVMALRRCNVDIIDGLVHEIQSAAEWDQTIRRIVQNDIVSAIVANASTPGAWLLEYIYSYIQDLTAEQTGADIELRSIPKKALYALANATLPVIRRNLHLQA